MMTKNNDSEKLRVLDIIKENASLVLAVGGFVWVIFQFLIIPIYKLQFQVGNIVDNHLATIQVEMTEAKVERQLQREQLTALSEQIIKLAAQLENK